MEVKINQERLHYMDAIRVIAILLMFFYHVSMVFVAEWGWHIKDASQSSVLLEVNYWLAIFRMPLLFFVSAFISCILLEKLDWKGFILQRAYRLIIPTMIWTFILVAPQIYFERKAQGYTMSYLEFYKTFLEFQWWPNGNFHWLHLWFIPYLFVYNVLSMPLFYFFQKGPELGNTKNIFVFVLLFIVVAVLPYTFLSSKYPVTYDLLNDFARHSYYLFFIIAGVVTYKYQEVLSHIERARCHYFRAAFLSILTINVIRWNGLEPQQLIQNWDSHPLYYFYVFFLNVNAWLWVLTLLGYGKKYLNKRSNFLSYANKAVYPFYILHQTVIVVIGYYVINTNDPTSFKFIFLLSVGFVITLLVYHLFILPFKPIRLLFGTK